MKNYKKLEFEKIGEQKKGFITALEQNRNIPFHIKRVYYNYFTPEKVSRGYHAHKKLKQVLVCLSGSLTVKVDDGKSVEDFELNKPNEGLYVGPDVWHEMHDYSKDAVLLVLASDYYNEEDYLRDYDEFIDYIESDDQFNNGYFKHDKAIVDSKNIGEETRVWGFSHILSGAELGRNCNVCEHVFIENDVIIGDNVTIKNGVYIWDGIRILDDVFIGPNMTFVNDNHPRSKQYPDKFEQTRINKGSSLGANSTILGGIEIGKYATVGAGAVVTKNVNPYEVVVGNPAQKIGYNCQCGQRLSIENQTYECKCGKKYIKSDGKLKRI
jgi:acetyltransferase-like isoleucine patch superfamily enzyme